VLREGARQFFVAHGLPSARGHSHRLYDERAASDVTCPVRYLPPGCPVVVPTYPVAAGDPPSTEEK